MKIRENVAISELTTMRIGGVARYVVEVTETSEVARAYDFAEEKGVPVFVLGGGANTIGRDEGFPGVIIINEIRGIEVVNEEGDGGVVRIRAMGGEPWDNVVAYACARGLTGIEALAKIPGSAGAAPVQNIGAYGQEVADTLVSVEAYDTATREFVTLAREELGFSYRKSILNTSERGRYFVTAILLELRAGRMQRPFYDSVERYIEKHGCTDFSPQGVRDIVSAVRAEKLPDPKVKASSGSFFKNIYLSEAEADEAEARGLVVHRGRDGAKINAGWLIEKCGLSGARMKGFLVNPKANLVLINESATSYAELAQAREEIRAEVRRKFGYELEQEPVEIVPASGVRWEK